MEILTKKVQLLERIEDKFKNMVLNKEVKLEIIEGELLEIDATNVSLFRPHRIVFRKGKKFIVILYYGSFIRENECFYLYNLSNKVNLFEIKQMISKL
ncbi:MAG: hypothetical protein PHN42_02790 [Bacilli bacterium]|nr:hypothetical protein [Bacilli bacterium]